jgi:hypothetical protein
LSIFLQFSLSWFFAACSYSVSNFIFTFIFKVITQLKTSLIRAITIHLVVRV